MAVGTMVELVAARNDIDTSDNLNIFEAFQKVFIVNGANLKVADFINTKITCSALTSPPAHGDILTQDQTGSKYAFMVVDFVNTAKTAIYGYAYYAGGATAFTTSHDISSNNATATMNPDPILHANISAIAAKPHWYDWTVYPDVVLTIDGSTKSYGSMPNKAYLGCLYRGRCTLSGDPEHPNQWYMARQNNPWDFAYIANDAGSPVKGGDADAGELGDVIRTLIPYKDDFLIHGCATSCWFVAGDPAEGGSINELDLTIGMFGANSWCFDGEGNLYFWGTNGIYKTTVPGTPKCISEIRLPKLIKDESIDPAVYRITMGYDRIRVGILVCITKLSDGTNSNYFYDLRILDENGIGGFFPESYPDECGPYSLFYYGANSSDYRDLLVGCKDGYIKKFDESIKNDNVGGTTQKINSYVEFGPLQIADDPKFEGKIIGLDLISAGGAANGSQSDSDDIDCQLYVAKSAEEIIEKLTAGTNPDFSKTLKTPGRRRGNNISRKIKGVYVGIQLRNNAAGETWGFEQLLIEAKKSGRFK